MHEYSRATLMRAHVHTDVVEANDESSRSWISSKRETEDLLWHVPESLGESMRVATCR